MTKISISPELSTILEILSQESIYCSILLNGDIPKEDLVDEPIDYLGLSTQDPSKLSYLTQDRISKLSVDDLWTSSRRYQGKPGVVLSKIFKNVNYLEFEKFTNSIKKFAATSTSSFSIVRGQDIIRYYDEDSYDKRTLSSLNSSCMKHKSCLDYFDLYVKNPEVISLLILTDKISGNLLGRALLWDLGEHRVMDRIYTTNDSVLRQLFKDWASINGYYHKLEQTWGSTLWFVWEGKKVYQEFELHLNIENISLFPYLDTFKFLDLSKGIIYNKNPRSKNIATLTSSSGSFHPCDYLSQCDQDLNYHNSSDIIYLDYRDINVNRSLVARSTLLKRFIHRDDIVYYSPIGDVIFNEKWQHLNGDLEALEKEYLEKRLLHRQSDWALDGEEDDFVSQDTQDYTSFFRRAMLRRPESHLQ